MRADIHDGPEHYQLQSKAGYIDARPFAAISTKPIVTRSPTTGCRPVPRYDANHDGIVTREKMEAGLKADFAAADTNGDGCLNVAETRAENQRPLARDGAQASPLVDWNLDSCVDFNEFSNTVRSYFEFVDKKKDGKVTLNELRGPSAPIPPVPIRTNSRRTTQGRPHRMISRQIPARVRRIDAKVVP